MAAVPTGWQIVAANALAAWTVRLAAEPSFSCACRYLSGRNSSTTTSCTDAFGGNEKCRWQ